MSDNVIELQSLLKIDKEKHAGKKVSEAK